MALIKSHKINKKTLPWITPELKQESKHLDYLYRRYKRKRIQPCLDAYRNFRDALNDKIALAKVNFFSNKLSTDNPPAVIWNELEHLGLTTPSATTKPLFTPDQRNSHFLSAQNSDPSLQLNDIPVNATRPPFKFTNITIDNLNWSFKQFTTKSKGPDGISLEVLKVMIQTYLTGLFLELPGYRIKVFAKSIHYFCKLLAASC